jgi:hypothetical protein
MRKLIWISALVVLAALVAYKLVASEKEEPAKVAPSHRSSAGGQAMAPAAPVASGSAPATPEDEGSGPVPSCADAIAKGLSGLAAGPEAAGIKDKLQEVYLRRCTEDKWPASVLRCYAGAVGIYAMGLCRGKLPPEQGAKLQADHRAVMAGGPGMTPPANGGGPVPVGGPPAPPSK